MAFGALGKAVGKLPGVKQTVGKLPGMGRVFGTKPQPGVGGLAKRASMMGQQGAPTGGGAFGRIAANMPRPPMQPQQSMMGASPFQNVLSKARAAAANQPMQMQGPPPMNPQLPDAGDLPVGQPYQPSPDDAQIQPMPIGPSMGMGNPIQGGPSQPMQPMAGPRRRPFGMGRPMGGGIGPSY